LKKIADRTAVVGVVGLGYVGLPLAGVFRRAGFPVIGFDIDEEKVVMLRAGKSYIRHLGDDFIAGLNSGAGGGKAGAGFEPTADFSRLNEADAVLICVPTPLDEKLEPDLSYVNKTAEDIGQSLRAGQLVVLESTTYPGTTREDVLPRLLAKSKNPDLRCGTDFFLAFSPEREDPGRKDTTTRQIPKVVGGIDEPSSRAAAALYGAAFEKIVPVSTAEVAEAAKLLENIYRAVNIALVNEMKVVLTAMGIDVWEVINAAATKPFGFQRFDPGPGLGGHCIPIDPFYLSWKAEQIGQRARFIELAGEVNHAMPKYVVDRTVRALAERGVKVSGSRILVLGLAYKADIDDVRESPSFELIEQFIELGAHVEYNDPHTPKTHRMRRHDLGMTSVPLTPQSLAGYDAVVISTAHSAYDWGMIVGHSRLIVDTRNATRGVPAEGDKVVRS
ncbi:MAG TPA: nucleotide sugar dehydrogenase, partial [Phycisphaerales bacterium]|nr:nucleotide sugar dehydrogenase [Phycisphaerales bacterium]